MRTGVLLSLLSIVGLTGCQEDEIRKYRVPKPAPENVNAQGDAGFRYTVPEGWEKTASSGPIRTEASFVIEKDGQSAQVTVTAFPGEAGGLAANINRWRNQIKLPTVGEAELEKDIEETQIGGRPAILVDIVGPEKQAILGGIAVHGGRSWFFKLMGPADLVANQKAAFETFLKSVEF